MAGVEEMGSFGAALARYLLAQGMEVFDVNRPDRTDRRHRGKPDPVDAQNAARAVPSGRARAQANSGDGPVQIARMFKLAKSSAAKARTQAINQLKTVLVSADPNLGDSVHAWGIHAGGAWWLRWLRPACVVLRVGRFSLRSRTSGALLLSSQRLSSRRHRSPGS
ncbi:hypothetical protein ACFXO2_34555 [Streptomyces sp. NPDC059152]|uniref:hypothetical protein n=1 Tax=Streptomyces sp. NPDC059152 TaxID=3346742 RepID=UPI0036872C5E